MTSLWRHSSTIKMATLPLKASRKELRNSVLLFIFSGQKDVAQIPFTLRCVQYYGDKCFTRPAIHVWCKKFACGQESVDEKTPGWCCFNDWSSDRSSRVSHTAWPACINKCSNKFGQYVEKYKVVVWHLNRFHCWTHSFSGTRNSQWRLTLGKW